MYHSKFRMTIVLAAAISLLGGCGSGGPDVVQNPVSPRMTGTATYDAAVVSAGVAAKGSSGLLRTSSNSSGTSQYQVSLQDLSGPYVLKFRGGDSNGQEQDLYAVATRAGVANLTPLTTLLVAQLAGQDPGATFNSFGGPAGAAVVAMVSDSGIQAAQAKVIEYLQNTVGVSVPTGSTDFVTTAFKPVAGDPMFDTLMRLESALAARGKTFASLVADIAAESHRCLTEKVEITAGAQQQDFCPASKSANPEKDDSSVLDYVFTTSGGDALTLKTQNDTVSSGSYVTASGQTYDCTAVACTGIALGAPGSDLTRDIVFTATQLNGQSGAVVLNGTLRGAIPGVALPVLPCNTNNYFVILPDRSVSAVCADPTDPFSFGAMLDNILGPPPTVAQYFIQGQAAQGTPRSTLTLYTAGNDTVLQITFRQFSDPDPNTGESTEISDWHCEGSACNGVTLGAVTEDDQTIGLPLLLRTVTFDHTLLAGINPDGTPTGTNATLIATFQTVYYAGQPTDYMWPAPASCPNGADTISFQVSIGDPFNFCTTGPHAAFVNVDGDLQLHLMTDDFTSGMDVILHNGALKRVSTNVNSNAPYSCAADCSGITVSTDTSGNYVVTFSGTVLHQSLDFDFPGPGAQTLNGGPITFAPP